MSVKQFLIFTSLAWGLFAVADPGVVSAAILDNQDQTFADSQTIASTLPDDYGFNANPSSVWIINDDATIIMRQGTGTTGNRFFVGINDGNLGEWTFTPNELPGVANIDGGGTIDLGWIFGEGASSRLNILDGRFNVLSDSDTKRLSGIDITLFPEGTFRFHGTTTDAADFQADFAPGSTIPATGGTRKFTSNMAYVPIASSTCQADTRNAGVPEPAGLLVVSGVLFGLFSARNNRPGNGKK